MGNIDPNGAFNKAYDDSTGTPKLRTTVIGSASAASGTQTDDRRDLAGILRAVFDESTQSIRVVTV